MSKPRYRIVFPHLLTLTSNGPVMDQTHVMFMRIVPQWDKPIQLPALHLLVNPE